MPIVTILWSGCATAAIILGSVWGSLWLLDRRHYARLTLFALGMAAAAAALIELGMMHSASPVEYGTWLRWYHVPVFLAAVAQLLFISIYLGSNRLWLFWSFILARSILLVTNVAIAPNFSFREIGSLRHITFLGERVSVLGTAVVRTEWQLFSLASLVLLLAYLADAVVKQWRKGDKESRRKARTVALGIAVPAFVTVAYSQLLVFRVLPIPVTDVPWFLGTLVTMAYELGRDVVLSQRARQQAAELGVQLAQLERVNALGQLASTLAHELRQPITANVANAEAALATLDRRPDDREELRSTILDILAGEQRASEMIARIGQLSKRRAIEMGPLSIEDFVEDALSLVRREMASRKIVLDVRIAPGLPAVLGDRTHLAQVLLNLLLNAVQALQSRKSGKRRIAIEARAVDKDRHVEVAVRDSGSGIPAAIENQIFDPLFSTKPEGMGMGLALSRTIIEAHGGRLWTDTVGQADGATFRFTVQRADASRNAPRARQPSPVGVGGDSPVAPRSGTTG